MNKLFRPPLHRLFFFLFCTQMAFPFWAQTVFEKDNIKYKIVDETATVMGWGTSSVSDGVTSLTIPGTISYNGSDVKVTAITPSAFEGRCSTLKSIVISENITTIGDYALYDCKALTSLTLPNSLVSIGIGAFFRCEALNSLTLPSGLTTIGEAAFFNCKVLTDIYAMRKIAPTQGMNCFIGHKSELTLHIAEGSTGYDTGGWENFISQSDLYNDDTEHYNMTAAENVSVAYMRDYHHTKWQPLFVPFNIPYSALRDKFEVAKLADEQPDAEIVKFTLLKEDETLSAHTIALIRSKETGIRPLIVENTSRVAPKTEKIKKVGNFEFWGTSKKYYAKDGLEGAYVMKDNFLHPYQGAIAPDPQPLRAFRWFILTSTLGTPKLSIEIGDGDHITHINSSQINTEVASSIKGNKSVIYTLDGRYMTKTPSRGIYILNGKKAIR